MRRSFTAGDKVVRLGWDGVPHEKMSVERVDICGIWTTGNRLWTKTGLEHGGKGPKRMRIRLMTPADEEHFERLRLADVLKRVEWAALDVNTLTQVLLCLGTFKEDKKEEER